MSFYTYAQKIRLDKRNDKQYLVAKVATGSSAGGDEAGWYIDPICLDDHIGNDHGSFTWSAEGGQLRGVSYYARDIKLLNDGRTLAAQLAAWGDHGGGGWQHATIDLGQRLANDHGRFKYVERVYKCCNAAIFLSCLTLGSGGKRVTKSPAEVEFASD